MTATLRRAAALLLVVGVAIPGVPALASPQSTGPVRVLVSVLPQQFLVERVGGEHTDVTVLVRAGQSHGVFDMTPRLMQAIEQAEVFFRTGVSAENAFLRQLSRALPELHIVDTCEGLDLLTGPGAECADASHDDHGHAEEAFDPHVWMDPLRAKHQAYIIMQTLAELRPGLAEHFRANAKLLGEELDAVDSELRAQLAPVRGKTIYAYHPAYAYFAERYGLSQESVETEGKDPGLRHINAVAAQMRQQGVRALFVQPQFAPAKARAIARSAGVAIVELDPLAPDYIDNLRRIGQRVSAALQQ